MLWGKCLCFKLAPHIRCLFLLIFKYLVGFPFKDAGLLAFSYYIDCSLWILSRTLNIISNANVFLFCFSLVKDWIYVLKCIILFISSLRGSSFIWILYSKFSKHNFKNICNFYYFFKNISLWIYYSVMSRLIFISECLFQI